MDWFLYDSDLVVKKLNNIDIKVYKMNNSVSYDLYTNIAVFSEDNFSWNPLINFQTFLLLALYFH